MSEKNLCRVLVRTPQYIRKQQNHLEVPKNKIWGSLGISEELPENNLWGNRVETCEGHFGKKTPKGISRRTDQVSKRIAIHGGTSEDTP